MVILEEAPFVSEAAEQELVPTDGVLLVNQGLDSGVRELIEGKRGVIDPTVDARDENADKAFTGSEG